MQDAKNRRHNTVVKYRAVKEEYRKWRNMGIPLVEIHRRYIYPKFFIGMRQFYNIIYTPDAELDG